MELQSTKGFYSKSISFLIYGGSYAGKTRLISTMPNPVILSAESGLLSLADYDLPFKEIKSMSDLGSAYDWLLSPAADQFESVAIDSISEIAEVLLGEEKRVKVNGKLVDPRQAYFATQEKMMDVIRLFRDLPKHVYFSAKLEKTIDEQNRILYGPSMPGQKTAQALPYLFDEVFALRVEKDTDGNPTRFLQTAADGLWLAKDRSGKLPTYIVHTEENTEMDLGKIIKKIKGEI